jgi:hypothetical protein
MGDILLGGNVLVSVPAVGLTWTQVLGRSNGRRAIVVSNPGANLVYLSWDPGATGTNGIPLASNTSLLLSAVQHGQLVRQELFAVTVTAPGVIFVAAEEPT